MKKEVGYGSLEGQGMVKLEYIKPWGQAESAGERGTWVMSNGLKWAFKRLETRAGVTHRWTGTVAREMAGKPRGRGN